MNRCLTTSIVTGQIDWNTSFLLLFSFTKVVISGWHPPLFGDPLLYGMVPHYLSHVEQLGPHSSTFNILSMMGWVYKDQVAYEKQNVMWFFKKLYKLHEIIWMIAAIASISDDVAK